MKVVKISAIWCGGCLVMNKVWNKLKDNYSFEAIELDYDMDEEEVKEFSPGDILPVFIIFDKDKEICRIIGEYDYSYFEDKFNEVGVKKCKD